MTRTGTALWMGLSWLTAVQTMYHISHKPTDYRTPENVRAIEANMTVRDVSKDWIEVDYELDDVPVIDYSIIQVTSGPNVISNECPSQHSERKMYTCRIEGLTPCTKYGLTYYGISTLDPLTVQYISEIGEVLTTADETIPPGNLTCTASLPGALMVEWVDPFPGDCLATFGVSWEGHALWDDGLSASGNVTTSDSFYTLTNLIPGADYSLDVVVWFQGVYQGAAASIHCTTLEEESSAPQNVSVTPSSYDVTVNWKAPAQLNGVITHYDVLATWANDSTAANTLTEGPTSEAVLPGLAPCSTYQVMVAAVNGAGPGAASDPVEATTLGDDVVNPIIRLDCTNETQAVSVTWSDVLTNCGISSYNLSYSALVAWDESKNVPLKDAALEGGLAFQVPEEDYVPGAQYSFEISTSTRKGSCNVMSNDETSSPPVISVADAGISYIYLAWEPPTAANGVIDSYELLWSDEEGSVNKTTIPINAVNEYNLTEAVFACSAYHVTLAAHNRAGLGEADTKDAETLRADLSGIICEVASDSSVLVSWTVAPAYCDRNGTFLSWEGQSQWDQYTVKDSTLLEDQVEANLLTDLHPFTDYNICVTLTEEWAKQACCDTTTHQGVPTAPESVTASSTFSSILLTWEQPDSWNGVPLAYVVVCPGVDLFEEVAVSTTEITISDLRAGTLYSIAVQACNEEQCSDSFMMEVSTEKGPSKDSNTGLIVGLTLGFTAIIALVIAFIVVRSRRRHHVDDQTERERVVPRAGFSPGEVLTEASSIASSTSGITVSKL